MKTEFCCMQEELNDPFENDFSTNLTIPSSKVCRFKFEDSQGQLGFLAPDQFNLVQTTSIQFFKQILTIDPPEDEDLDQWTGIQEYSDNPTRNQKIAFLGSTNELCPHSLSPSRRDIYKKRGYQALKPVRFNSERNLIGIIDEDLHSFSTFQNKGKGILKSTSRDSKEQGSLKRVRFALGSHKKNYITTSSLMSSRFIQTRPTKTTFLKSHTKFLDAPSPLKEKAKKK